MPWFPDFVNAVQLARRQSRTAGQADPVTQYLIALQQGDTQALEAVWPGELVVHDPRAGRVSGHRQLRAFVKRNQDWLAEHHARIEMIASTRGDGRAVVELLAHVSAGRDSFDWPVAVVAESPNDRSVVFRTYCSQWPVDRQRHVRSPILQPQEVRLPAVVSRFLDALGAGDVQAAVSAFTQTGYFRESLPKREAHHGTAELRSFFAQQFSVGGGIGLQPCSVTDDGVRCAVEFNCDRWGTHELPPQAGIGVYERDADGLLAAVRVYDDIESPVHLDRQGSAVPSPQ
jgi:limonene-1,2-epoxide hydrolase